MIYPYNVHREVRDAGKATGQDLSRFFGFLMLIIGVILYFVIDFVLSTLIGDFKGLALIITLVLLFFIGYYMFRFFIFREDEKMAEYQGQERDTFARYVHIRKDTEQSVRVLNSSVDCFEYTNGSVFCVLQFKFGSNDTEKAKNTFMLFKKIIHILGENGLEFRLTDLPEDFFHSEEYSDYAEHLNAIENKNLAHTLIYMADHMLQTSRKLGNTSTIYLEIIAINSYKVLDFETALNQIMTAVNKTASALRGVYCLNLQGLLEYMEQYYNMEVIDLSTMKVLEYAENGKLDFNNAADVYQVITEDDKVFRSEKGKIDLQTDSREVK